MVIAFTGSIDMLTVAQVRRELLKDLSEEPYALVCDLAGVDHPRAGVRHGLLDGGQPPGQPLAHDQLPALWRAAARWPRSWAGCRCRTSCDCSPTSTRRSTKPWPARRTCATSCGWPPTPTAAAAARAFVREVCRYWQIARPDATVTDRAVLLANELVTNAVVHAHTELRLRLELRGDRLHIAVRDGSPRLLRLVAPDGQAEGGRGLWLIEQLARAWGVNPHPEGGKVVWCVIDL